MRKLCAIIGSAAITASASGIVETFESAPVGPGDGDVFLFPTFPSQTYTFGDYRFFSDTSIWGCLRASDPAWSSSGFPGGVVSGEIVLYGFGQDLRVERADTARMTLGGFWATGAYQNGIELRIRGLRGGVAAYDQVIGLGFGSAVKYDLDFVNVDEVLFNIDMVGTPVPGAGGTDAIFVIDDMKLELFVPCVADVTTAGAAPGDPGYGEGDGVATAADLNFFVNAWVSGDTSVADVTTTGAGIGDPGFGVPDGNVTAIDLNFFVNAWNAGCP